MENTFVIINDNIVDISLCVDRSGSMQSMYKQTIRGVKKFIEEQQKTAQETGIKTYITIKSFDDVTETIPGFDANNILDVPELDYDYLYPKGSTKLIDTAVEALLEQNRRYKDWKSQQSNENYSMKRIFALLTDGQDNSSILYNQAQMNHYMTQFRNDGVICMFLGANQDAIQQGNVYGFTRGHSMTYAQTADCAENTFRSLSAQVSSACRGEQQTEFTQLQRSASCNTTVKKNTINKHQLQRS